MRCVPLELGPDRIFVRNGGVPGRCLTEETIEIARPCTFSFFLSDCVFRTRDPFRSLELNFFLTVFHTFGSLLKLIQFYIKYICVPILTIRARCLCAILLLLEEDGVRRLCYKSQSTM